jgi:adenosylcobalamin-dependent ribonucleoside-diphosphate reductase
VLTYTRAGREHGYFASDDDAMIFEHELTWMLLHQVFSFNSPVWFNVGTPAKQQVSACQPYDALVHTPSGLIPIGRIVEDDLVGLKVFDAHGLTKVVATKANGVKDVLRLHTKAGYTLDVTADHLVWKAGSMGSGQFVEAGTLRPGDKLEWNRRDSGGDAGFDPRDVSEAALAGWLQSDGFVGQYATGTNRSLTTEYMTVNDDELSWVRQHLDVIFGGRHSHERTVETQCDTLDCRRTRMYGEHQREFIERWGLLARGTDMVVPESLFTAPLPVVTAYLRSVFQAEGFVSARTSSTLIGLAMISEELIRGMQSLLLRFGIFSRVACKADKRPNRHDTWELRIQTEGDRDLFETHIGFIGSDKAAKLAASFDKPGLPARETKVLEIARIEHLGPIEVYDIQTESGEYLSGGLRVHNCFILAVDDTMESILNWYREEGLIFKGGSGSGINLSRIRSSKELLHSGGTASGPVSFMRGADASAGTIKSGGATRRAAKMVVLDVDHPDIAEFVQTKAREEDKIRVLRDAGFDMDLGGRDIASVQYQNANNSVRVTDEFMRAVEAGESFGLRARTNGEVIETVDARELWRSIAQAAWECADPGIQYDDTINEWHTSPESGRITASNPCSEYLHLDNSSCNLASLNLMRFLESDGSFDAELFAKSVELVITAMDISICFADFPTEAIGDTTRKFRQLGIGYANLGALLMASGLAYDSEGGRALAASITSLMTGTAYRRSAELAGVVGAYDGYGRNVEPHKRVMRKHAESNGRIASLHELDAKVKEVASREWSECLRIGDINGYRNAQASVLAPTGTIGFKMDVDTTGIEPDFSLVKFKKLVGGGSMQIVNQTIPRALRKFGYSEETIEAIVAYIAEHGHVVDAPGLRPEHYEVFDCAVGTRSISPMGHVRMMAAVQPFLSGAISKTVNMPEEATVDDVAEVYFEGWKMGIKALAIYRDNCKVGQPLSTGSSKKPDTTASASAESAAAPATDGSDGAAGPVATVPVAAEPEVRIEYRPIRKRLPKKRPANTTSFTVGGAQGYMISSSYPDDGLGELFLKMAKQGSTLAGVMDAFSIAVSIGLQYGVPLETYVEKFTNMRFEPAGITDDPDVRMTSSIVDYVFRRLALDYLDFDTRSGMGIYSAEERQRQLETGSYLPSDEDDDQGGGLGDDFHAPAPVQASAAPAPAAPAESAAVADHTGHQHAGEDDRDTPERLTVEAPGSIPVARPVSSEIHSSAELMDALQGRTADSPICMTCGVKMRPAGSCYVCEGCGSTSGCS